MSNSTVEVIINQTTFYKSLIVGLTYSVLSVILLTIYMIYNIVLLLDKDFRNLQAYRLMLFIGLLDCIQLFCHFMGGVLTLFYEININYPFLCKVIGATINSAWVGLFPLTLAVAVNRLLIFQRTIKAEGRLPFSMKVVVVLSFLYVCAFWLCLMTFAEVTYYPNDFAWSYADTSASAIMSEIEYIISVICIAVTFIVYIVVTRSIYKMRKGTISVRPRELHLLAHAAILFVTLTSLITCWHYYQAFLPDTEWTKFSINNYWILYCGMNPILCMVFSRNLRVSFARFLGVQVTNKKAIKTTSAIAVTS